MEGTRWLDEREQRAWRSLQLMQMQLTARMSRDLAASSSLSYPDYVVLAMLTGEPEGPVRLFELARAIGWEKSRLSHHLARMVDRGLVTKQRCAEDRRGSWVTATEQGRREIAAAAPGHVDTVRRAFLDHLRDDQLDTIADVATTVLAVLARDHDEEDVRTGRPPPGA